MRYSLTEQLEWTSHARRTSKTKRGSVIAIVPAGQNPLEVARQLRLGETHVFNALNDSRPRKEESYLISVPSANPKSRRQLYCPKTSMLRRAGTGPVTPPQQTNAPAQPQPVHTPAGTNNGSGKRLLNYIAILLDNSGSMNPDHNGPALIAANQQIQLINDQSKSTGQESMVATILFGHNVTWLQRHFTPSNQIVPVHEGIYRANEGRTRLFDAVVEAVSVMRRIAVPKDCDVAWVLQVITDGEDNLRQCGKNNKEIQDLFNELFATNRWTITMQVPSAGYKAKLVRDFGIPADNIQVWDTTDKRGIEVAAPSHARGTVNFFQGRTKGRTSTTKFYLDLDKVTQKDLEKKLVDVTSHFRSWQVPKDGLEISEFIKEKTGKDYSPGSAYYELIKTEELLPGRSILVQKHGEKELYGGPGVYELLGLPLNEKCRIEMKNNGGYKIFVQSASSNRHLTAKTRVYFDESHVPGSTVPTWIPVAQPASSSN